MSDRRPLYVNGDKAALLKRDGPALAVTGLPGAPLRVPLRRLSRVVLIGEVRIAHTALMACFDADIPLTVIGVDGRTRGWCLGGGERSAAAALDLGRQLDDLLHRHDWRPVIDNWQRAAERHAILKCRALLVPMATDLRPEPMVRALYAALPSTAPIPPARAVRRFQALMDAQLLEVLLKAGAPPRFLGNPHVAIDLMTSFRRILTWSLWPPVNDLLTYLERHAAKHPTDREIQARIVRHYEAFAPAIQARSRRLVADLSGTLMGDGL